MKIGPIEIYWRRPKAHDFEVWHRPPLFARRLGSMTPEQLRRELAFVLEELHAGRVLSIPAGDPFFRIHSN